jgi:hypothetical protein
MPNFVTLIKDKWKQIGIALVVLVGAVFGFEKLSNRDMFLSTAGQSETQPPHQPSQLASQDPVILAKQNERDQSLLQTRTLIDDLKNELILLKNQRLEDMKSGQDGLKRFMTRGEAQGLVRQAVAESEAARQRALADGAAQEQPPTFVWQQVAPATEPAPEVPATQATPEKTYVTVLAGSNAHARSFNGILTLADGLRKTITIDIGDMEGPNGGRIPLNACRAVGSYGAGRAEAVVAKIPIQVHTLSCMLPSGRAISVPVKGYLSSLDDIDGIPATVIFQDDKLLLKVLQAATPAAIVSLASETRTRVTRFGPLGEVTEAGNIVAQDTAGRIVDMYLRQAELYVTPILAVKPNIDLNIYFEETFQLPVEPGELLVSGFNPDTYN